VVAVSTFKESVVVDFCLSPFNLHSISCLIWKGTADPSVQFLQHGRCSEAQGHTISFGLSDVGNKKNMSNFGSGSRETFVGQSKRSTSKGLQKLPWRIPAGYIPQLTRLVLDLPSEKNPQVKQLQRRPPTDWKWSVRSVWQKSLWSSIHLAINRYCSAGQ
jgi:hypothetical protein